MTTKAKATSRTRRVLWACGVVAGLGMTAGVLVAANRQPSSAPTGSGPRITSDLVEVTRTDFDITTTATGELRARNQVEIRSTLESETQIVEIIPEGTFVTRGSTLIKLNGEPIQNRIEEETLQLESARASLVEAEESYQIQVSENESSTRAAELKLALAQLDLDQWRQGELESKRQELDHALERAEKDEQRLREKLDKSRSLNEKGYYSRDQLKQDELSWEQAKNTLAKARLDKQVYWEFQHPKDKRKKESEVEEARAELDRVGRQNASRLASKEADRNNKRQVLTIRQQKFDKYKEQLLAAHVKAPRDGLVVYSTSMETGWRGGDDGPLQVGKKVMPNELLLVLPDTSEMIAAVRVHESLAGRVRPGQIATVKVDAAGDKRYTGTVDSIGILAESTGRWMDPNLREYTVRILLDLPKDHGKDQPTDQAAQQASGDDSASSKSGTDTTSTETRAERNVAMPHGLKPSMRAEAELRLGKVRDAITVPIQAVFSDGLVRFVHLRMPDGKFKRQPVAVGQRSDRFAEIRAGIEPAQWVLIRRPDASEVLAGGWDPKDLALVGLGINDQGVVVPTGGGPAGAPGGRPGGRGRPGGEPAAAAPNAPAATPPTKS